MQNVFKDEKNDLYLSSGSIVMKKEESHFSEQFLNC